MSKRERSEGLSGQKVVSLPSAGPHPLPAASLPPPETTRWVASRKAAVVAALRCGFLTVAEACHRYALSREEILSWRSLAERYGVAGLHVTRLTALRGHERMRNSRPG